MVTVVFGLLFLGMVFCFLIYIIDAVVDTVDTIDTNSEREAIIKDFFRYFRKIDPHSEDITLTFNQFLAFYNVSSEYWKVNEYYNIWFTYKNDGERFTIRFKTYGDQMKYRLWRRKKKKHDNILASAREMNRFIENIRQQSKRAEEEAMREADELRGRISKELEKGENHVSMGR